VLKLYSAVWFARAEAVAALIQEHVGVQRLVVRLSRNIQKAAAREALTDGAVIFGPPVEGQFCSARTG
jgi:hypothetical protein